eukprot:2344759-Lingulodinium_polyedra.AAC.1
MQFPQGRPRSRRRIAFEVLRAELDDDRRKGALEVAGYIVPLEPKFLPAICCHVRGASALH